jgi:hypothetical protein
VPPTPAWSVRRTLERGQWNPRKGYGHLSGAHAGQHRDVKPVERVSPHHLRPCVAIPDAVQPSQALQRHPRCCGNLGRQDIATLAAVHLTTFCQSHPRVSVRTKTKREAPTQAPSKPLLGWYRSRHDARREQDSSGRPSTPWRCTPYRHT